MRGESRQELISDGTTLPGRRSCRYSRTSASNESSSSRSPVGALLFWPARCLDIVRQLLRSLWKLGQANWRLPNLHCANRVALRLCPVESRLAGLASLRMLRECLRIKIEQVEIVIRPLDDTPPTGSSKLDFGGRKGGARSAAVFCRASDHRHPRSARTEVSSQQSRPSQTPSDHLKIEGPMPFRYTGWPSRLEGFCCPI
ncbi:hypothetical protein ACVWWG_001925 [Bradyrhizobium sp. LB7.2]